MINRMPLRFTNSMRNGDPPGTSMLMLGGAEVGMVVPDFRAMRAVGYLRGRNNQGISTWRRVCSCKHRAAAKSRVRAEVVAALELELELQRQEKSRASKSRSRA